eukprot:3809728-Rhodomonas_salina.1
MTTLPRDTPMLMHVTWAQEGRESGRRPPPPTLPRTDQVPLVATRPQLVACQYGADLVAPYAANSNTRNRIPDYQLISQYPPTNEKREIFCLRGQRKGGKGEDWEDGEGEDFLFSPGDSNTRSVTPPLQNKAVSRSDPVVSSCNASVSASLQLKHSDSASRPFHGDNSADATLQ